MVDLTVQYRDEGKDVFHNIAGHSVSDGMLIVEEANHRFVCIILNVMTFFVVEEVK